MGQVEDIMNAWKKQLDAEMDSKCVTLARQVLQRALYYREQLVANDIGHNYTGNFVNSIVCGVWKNGANISMLLGSKIVGREPIMAKMTNRKNGGGRTYLFNQALKKKISEKNKDAYVVHKGPDYDDATSQYSAEVRTNTAKRGYADALDFIKNFHPHVRKGYVIALGYPVEYAAYIEKLRASTGLALLEDEFTSKVEQIRKFFMFESTLKTVNSGLSKDSWDEMFATKQAYGMGIPTDEIPKAVNAILNEMAEDGYRLQPGLGNNITFVASDASTLPQNDPLGGSPSTDDVPF